jgi:hypothetical protein
MIVSSYRIKKTERYSRTTYTPQKRFLFFWVNIGFDDDNTLDGAKRLINIDKYRTKVEYIKVD